MANERRNVNWLNDMTRESPKELVSLSERLYRDQIDRTAMGIAQDRTSILLVSGPSASTKTTTAKKLSERLAELGFHAEVISLDDFFIDRRLLPKLPNGDTDFESIATVDLPALNRCLGELLAKGESDFPIFDFPKGRRSELSRRIRLTEKTLLIMEGIHALNPAVMGTQNPGSFKKIYISPNSDYYWGETRILKARQIRLIRRLVRDFFHRGNTVENTLWMWENVVASERVNILPFKEEADYLIDSTILYEPSIYAYWLDRILDQSAAGERFLPKVQELTEALSCFAPLPLDLVPEDTVLHEFLQ